MNSKNALKHRYSETSLKQTGYIYNNLSAHFDLALKNLAEVQLQTNIKYKTHQTNSNL
jgi:hypothetical protein